MVIDTSALLAILLDEPERLAFTVAIDQADTKRLSVAGFVEASIVLEARTGAEGARDLDDFLTLAGIDFEPVTVPQGRLAARAFARFGKGRHPAGLNFGDCFAYALAMAYGEPLLFKGDDFAKTDVPR